MLTNALSRLTSLGLPIAHVCRFLQDKLIRAQDRRSAWHRVWPTFRARLAPPLPARIEHVEKTVNVHDVRLQVPKLTNTECNMVATSWKAPPLDTVAIMPRPGTSMLTKSPLYETRAS